MHGAADVPEGQQLQSRRMFPTTGTPFASLGVPIVIGPALNQFQLSFAGCDRLMPQTVDWEPTTSALRQPRTR